MIKVSQGLTAKIKILFVLLSIIQIGADAKKYKAIRKSPPLFHSQAIEDEIVRVKGLMKDKDLAEIFELCYPNTLDTTVMQYEESGPLTYVITGDIDAMWLRDSTNQVIQYIDFIGSDPKLKSMIKGVINKQKYFINIDPYANAFNLKPKRSEWYNDYSTEPNEKGERVDVMKSEKGKYLWERKYEVDSLAAFLKISAVYVERSGDFSIFDNEWLNAYQAILKTFEDNSVGLEDQDKKNYIPYTFIRNSNIKTESLINGRLAYGKTCGLIGSGFRPSDDACTHPYLIPANAMAQVYLNKTATFLMEWNQNLNESIVDLGRAFQLGKRAHSLAKTVKEAIYEHGVVKNSQGELIFAYEVDCNGKFLLMDDANVPSLLSLPYLEFISADDPLYKNTRKFLLSKQNPQYYQGRFKGIGSPHTPSGYIWHMSIIMQALTSQNDTEILDCIQQLKESTCGSGQMHEGFSKDNDCAFSRSWFSWANSIFGELIIHVLEHKPYLLT